MLLPLNVLAVKRDVAWFFCVKFYVFALFWKAIGSHCTFRLTLGTLREPLTAWRSQTSTRDARDTPDSGKPVSLCWKVCWCSSIKHGHSGVTRVSPCYLRASCAFGSVFCLPLSPSRCETGAKRHAEPALMKMRVCARSKRNVIASRYRSSASLTVVVLAVRFWGALFACGMLCFVTTKF